MTHTPSAAPVTTYEGLARAWLSYEGSWDGHQTIALRLPVVFAEQMLRARGWRSGQGRRASSCFWVAPNGDRYWSTDEALELALVAEVL